MKKVILFSLLLILGLILSQFLIFIDVEMRKWVELLIKNLALVLLAFIMIHVGMEFSIDKRNLRQYGWDYFVACTAATLPWIFCAVYFVCFFQHGEGMPRFYIWTDALLLARFAAPTSAGVLFTMMAAAGLEKTWMFKKARILAIFDDLDTIILLIPIKMMLVGFSWEAIGLLSTIAFLIYVAWKKMHSLACPIQWYWVLFYSVMVAVFCETLYFVTASFEGISPIQLEILLPAFVLGCILVCPIKKMHELSEERVKFFIGALFIFLVGVSMPTIEFTVDTASTSVSFWQYKIGNLSMSLVILHVLALTFLSNLGKMFPLFCYRKEATLKERLALSLGMCPRGEVGAGVIILAMGLVAHIDQTLIMIAMLSLALNLVLTGPLIMIIKKLLTPRHAASL